MSFASFDFQRLTLLPFSCLGKCFFGKKIYFGMVLVIGAAFIVEGCGRDVATEWSRLAGRAG